MGASRRRRSTRLSGPTRIGKGWAVMRSLSRLRAKSPPQAEETKEQQEDRGEAKDQHHPRADGVAEAHPRRVADPLDEEHDPERQIDRRENPHALTASTRDRRRWTEWRRGAARRRLFGERSAHRP